MISIGQCKILSLAQLVNKNVASIVNTYPPVIKKILIITDWKLLKGISKLTEKKNTIKNGY